MSHTIGQAEQNTQESNSNLNQSPQDSLSAGASRSAPVSRLSDTNYEFLFNQLLEGIAHGWHDRRIVKFFDQLGDRGKQADWVAWFGRLRGKLLKLPIESKRQLGTVMIRFGELTQSATEVNQIGAASYRLGRELLFGEGDNVSTIWEYAGPDLSLETKSRETETELSQRLPDDFTALGEERIEELENVEFNPVTAVQSSSDDNSSDVVIEIDKKNDDVSEAKIASEDPNRIAEPVSNSVDAYSETLVSADELWADDLFVASEPDVNKSAEDINLDLDLDGEVSSNEEKFELDSQSSNAVESSANIAKPEVVHQESAVDLQPELSISPSNNLSELPDERDSDPQSSPTERSEKESIYIELEDRELDRHASLPDSLVIDEQREMPSAIASELDDSSLELIESWFNLGLKHVSAGEYDKAIASWDKALTINANLPEAWHNRGSALGRLGNYEAAVKSFQNALEIDPDNYQAWNDRAHALYQLQEWSGAVECWSRAIEIIPGNYLFWYNRGCSLEQLEKWSEAIASYEKALEIKPDFQPGRSRYINLVADNSRPN